MTMNREMNMEGSREGGGGSHPLMPGDRSCRVLHRHRRRRSKESTLVSGSPWYRSAALASLMHWGVLLIVVNSIVLCSCNSISINSESKNTVLGADGHDEAAMEIAGGSFLASAITPTTTTTSTTTTSVASGTSAGTKEAPLMKIAGGADASTPPAEGKRRDNTYNKKESGLSDNSSHSNGKGSVRINVSNNTTTPMGAFAKPKPKTVAAKEYWNKQQKVAGVLKGAKKGKYSPRICRC